MDFAAMLCGDTVDHARGVECPDDIAGPLFALPEPTQQSGENLVRVHKASVFGYGADAVGIAIGSQAGIASLAYHRLVQQGRVCLSGVGRDVGEQWIQFLADGNMLNSSLAEPSGQNAT